MDDIARVDEIEGGIGAGGKNGLVHFELGSHDDRFRDPKNTIRGLLVMD